jgi:hypothetical protein
VIEIGFSLSIFFWRASTYLSTYNTYLFSFDDLFAPAVSIGRLRGEGGKEGRTLSTNEEKKYGRRDANFYSSGISAMIVVDPAPLVVASQAWRERALPLYILSLPTTIRYDTLYGGSCSFGSIYYR